MTVWEFRTPGTGLCHYVSRSTNLFAQLMPSLWVPLPLNWGSRGGKSSPLLGSPVTPWSICWTPFSSEGWSYTAQFWESVQVSNHADFPDLYQLKLEVQLWLPANSLQQKFLHSFFSKKYVTCSFLKPVFQISTTSDLGFSCSNSALQAHSSCARQEQQTFCSFSSYIFFQNQTLQRRLHCLLSWKEYILI